MRALSSHWHKSIEGRWSRSSALNGDVVDDIESESPPTPSELCTSPTGTVPGTVKTYSYSPERSQVSGEDYNSIVEMKKRRPLLFVVRPSEDRGDESVVGGTVGGAVGGAVGGGVGGTEDDLELLGSFASGMLDKFESTLAQLTRKGDSLSRSLPNVFRSSGGLDVVQPTLESRFSVTSDTSSKDEFLTDDEFFSPAAPIHSGSSLASREGISNWNQHKEDSFDCSTTTEDTPSNYSTSRRNTLESLETEGVPNVFEHQQMSSPMPEYVHVLLQTHTCIIVVVYLGGGGYHN